MASRASSRSARRASTSAGSGPFSAPTQGRRPPNSSKAPRRSLNASRAARARRRLAAAAPAPLLAVLADGDRGAAERRAVEVPDGRVAGLGRRELHDAAALGAAVGVGRHARVDDVEAGLAEEVLQVVPLHGRVEARDEDARPLEVAAAGVARAVAREVARLAALVAELLGLPPPRRRLPKPSPPRSGSRKSSSSGLGARRAGVARRRAARRRGASAAHRIPKAASIARRIDCSDSALDCTVSVVSLVRAAALGSAGALFRHAC